jgi:hypothetical protein
MTNHVVLKNVDRRDLKVRTGRSAAYGDDVMTAVTFPIERRAVRVQG